MKDLFYYSIFAVILYFVLTTIFDNFTLEQENFDPSLVPVSSIITLAKVAQKLVNGNGTLTNPGNLQIGSSTSAPGNLTVTGNANINGTLTLGGTDIGKYVIDKINTLSSSLTTNALTVNGNASVTGDLTVKGTNILDTINSRATALENTLNNRVTTLDSSLNNKATTLENTLNSKVNAIDSSLNNKVTTLENSLNSKATELASSFTTNNLTVNGNLKIGSKGMFYGNGDPYANDGWVRLMKSDGSTNYVDGGFATSNLYSQLDTTVNRNLQVNGNVNIANNLSFKAIICPVSAWDANVFLQTAKPYFNSSMPEGTAMFFLFTMDSNSYASPRYLIKYRGKITSYAMEVPQVNSIAI